MVLRATPEKREEKERVRHELLRAALELGAQHGFASLGLREVARAASIAPTSFYRHFADMSELGLALVEQLVRPMLEGIAARVTALAEDVSSETIAASLVDGMLAAAVADAKLVRFLVAERVGAFASLRGALATELAALASALHARDEGRARDPRRAAYAADAAVALLVDGVARALDAQAAERAQLREALVGTLSLLLGAGRSARRQA